MFKDQYDALNESIHPSTKLVERTKKQKKTKPVYKVALVMTMVCMIIGSYYIWLKQESEIKKPIVVNEKKDIYYKDLSFANGEMVTMPKDYQGRMLDIVGFREELLAKSDEVIKVTIEEANIVKENDNYFIVYKAKINKVYYGALKQNNYVYIKDDLYYYSPCLGSSIQLYIENHQYIIAIAKDEISSNYYHSIYPFGAQVEITLNNEYIFQVVPNSQHGGFWVTLANEKSKKVKDKDWLYYRSDSNFEEDFQKIVDTYCQ